MTTVEKYRILTDFTVDLLPTDDNYLSALAGQGFITNDNDRYLMTFIKRV